MIVYDDTEPPKTKIYDARVEAPATTIPLQTYLLLSLR
jgi:hypothetical protein